MKMIEIAPLIVRLELSPIDCLGIARLCRAASEGTGLNNGGEALAETLAVMLEAAALHAWQIDNANPVGYDYSSAALWRNWGVQLTNGGAEDQEVNR